MSVDSQSQDKDKPNREPTYAITCDSVITDIIAFLNAFLPYTNEGQVMDAYWSDRVKFARDMAALAAFERAQRIFQADLDDFAQVDE
jgi:hypothetical protein